MDSTRRRSNGKAGALLAWCPETLDLDALIQSEGLRVAEGVLWLGHCVLVGLAHNARSRDNGGRVPLKTSYLRNAIGCHHLDAVREAAQRIGYVGRDRSYRAGTRSQRYFILEPHAAARPIRREITVHGLRQNIRRWRDARQREVWERIRRGETAVAAEVCEHLGEQLPRVRIDDDLDLGEDLQPAHLIAADHIRARELWFKVDDYGRVHTPLTNLPRFLRSHLTVDGRRLVGVDIGESQPLFIGLALAAAKTQDEEGKGRRGRSREGRRAYPYVAQCYVAQTSAIGWTLGRSGLSGDLRRYLALCEAGGLYQAVADHLGVTRDEAKPKVMQVFFDVPWHRNRTYRVLGELFPSVMRAIGEMKQGNYRRLAHFAQRVESAFMYGQVVPRIMAERPGLFVGTIHDSILTTEGEERYVRQVILEEFARLGVSPNVKIEATAGLPPRPPGTRRPETRAGPENLPDSPPAAQNRR